jgi:hypothetical protein
MLVHLLKLLAKIEIKTENGKRKAENFLIFLRKNLFSKIVDKSAERAFLYNKKRVSLHYVFARRTNINIRAAAVSKEVTAADVGERVQIKDHYKGL